MTEQLGRLERVTDLREIWKTAAAHFTSWLARVDHVDFVDQCGLVVRNRTEDGRWRKD